MECKMSLVCALDMAALSARCSALAKILPDALRSRCTYEVHTAVTFRTC